MTQLWGALWHSKNRLDGVDEHLIRRNRVPVLFTTRAAARAWITKNYGYIETQPDLRMEPLGWRMPRPVKVCVVAASGEEGKGW